MVLFLETSDIFLATLLGREGGGQKYKAAALGVQHEVEDIRQELVKLLKTINSTNDGIIGAENELQKKVRGLHTEQSIIFFAFRLIVAIALD